jgi:integrase
MAIVFGGKDGKAMPRRNTGPRLRWLAKRDGYYICWTESGRSRERSAGTRDRAEAEAALAAFLRERQRTGGPRDPHEILLTDILGSYAEERGPKVAAPRRIADAINPLVGFWSGRVVGDVTRQTCEAYCRWRARSNGTTRRELGVLRAAIRHAHNEGRLTRVVAVHLPEPPESRSRFLTKDEADRLIAAAESLPRSAAYLPLFIRIALHTGARKEAILSLRWPQVDMEAGRIDWNPVGRRRTKKQRPRVAIPSQLLPHLKAAWEFRAGDIGYVVHDDGARILDPKKSFANACAKAGLADVSPHVLRHTRATWGMQAGANKWELAGFLGMTVETLESVYGHHHPDYQRHAAESY